MGPLEVVRLSTIQLRNSQDYYERTIRGAWDAGCSMDEIAKVAEINYRQVLEIVAKRGNKQNSEWR